MRIYAPLLAVLAVGCKPPTPAAADLPVTIPIAAMNDFHGALYEAPMRGEEALALGGLPWLVAAVNAWRDEDPELVVLDGGDVFQGSWPVNATLGRGAVDALNLLKLDAAAIGNHEFDYGGTESGHPLRGALEAGTARAEFAWLTANIRTEAGERWAPDGVAQWTVIERKGKRLGIIGLTTADTPQVTVPKHVADLEFVDVVQAVADVLPEVQAADVDAMILVGHLTGQCKAEDYLVPGEPCLPSGEVGRLLTELPAGTFDVMVLGHAHTLLAHRWDDTFLLENRAKGQMLGRVDLVFGPDGVDLESSRMHTPWALTHAMAEVGCEGGDFPIGPLEVGGRQLLPDPEALALIERLEAEAGSLCTELACAAEGMTRTRTAESPMGNWISDALLDAFPTADLGVQNSGGIRSDLPAGTVRRQQLQAVMPFDNRSVLVEMTGAQVLTMLRIGTSGGHGVLQLAGGTMTVDPTHIGGSDLDGDGEQSEWEVDRLCSATIAGTPIDTAHTYRVATSDFLQTGGDHLGPAFQGATVVEEGPLLREILYAYAEATSGCIGDAPLVDPEAPRLAQASCPR